MKKLSVKTRNIIITSTVCTVAIVTGIVLGTFFGKEFFGSGPTFSADDPLSLEDDNEKLFKDYQKGKIKPEKLKPHEIVNLAIQKFEDTKNHYSVTKGDVTVDNGFDIQSVDTVSGRADDKFFMESISCGKFVSVAKRFYQEGDAITEYTGSKINKSELTAKWGSEINFATPQEFEDKWGKEVSRSSIYIISSKTVTEEKSSIDAEGNYSINLKFNHEDATIRYDRQIVNMSGLNDLPKFHALEIDYTITKDFDLISREVRENYDVNKLGTHNSMAILREQYYIGGFEIPELDKDCNLYGGKE